MANSGTIQAFLSSNYPSACWSFEWTAAPTNTPGVSKVSWKVYGKGGVEDATTLWGWFEVLLWDPVGKKYVSQHKSDDAGYSFTGTKAHASGSFNVNHSTDGSGYFWIKIQGRIYEYATNPPKYKEQKCDLDTNYPYTDCQKPTSVTIAPTIQKPGGSIIVSWSGADGGNGGNSISKYQLWYKIGSGSWSTAYETTSTSYTITLPTTATRGANIQACVRAIGSVAGYDSEDAYSSTTASKVNNLPEKPKVSADKTIIAGGESATLTFTAGSDKDSSQSTSVWYSTTGKTEDEKQYTKSFTVTPASNNWSQTYTVWTWDGLEYSNPSTITLRGNKTTPTLTIDHNSETAITTSDCKHAPTDANYIVKPNIKLTMDNAKKYWFAIQYGTSKTNLSHQINISTDWVSSNTFSNIDIRNYLPTLNTTYYYKFICWAKDDIEEVVKTDTVTNAVARAPKLLFTHNGTNPNNNQYADRYEKEQAYSNNYSSHLFVYFERDPAYNCIRIASSSSGSWIKSPYLDLSWNQLVYPANNFSGVLAAWADLANYFERGSYTNFYIAPTYYSASSGKYEYESYRQSTGARLRANLPVNNTFTWSGTYYPFREDENTTYAWSIPFLTQQNLPNYGFLGNDGLPYNLTLKATIDSITGNSTSVSRYAKINSDKIDFSISNSVLYDALPESTNRDKNDTYSLNLIISGTNLFGDPIVFTSTKILDFRESAPAITNTGSLWVNLGSGSKSVSEIGFLKEGVKLYLQGFECQSHHGTLTQGQIEFRGNWYTFELENKSKTGVGINSYYTYISKTVSPFLTIGPVSSEEYLYDMRVYVSNRLGGEKYDKTYIPINNASGKNEIWISPHTSPVFKLKEGTGETVNKKIALVCKTEFTDLGIWYPGEGNDQFVYRYNNYAHIKMHYIIDGSITGTKLDEYSCQEYYEYDPNESEAGYSDLNRVKNKYSNSDGIRYEIDLPQGVSDWKQIKVWFEVRIDNYANLVGKNSVGNNAVKGWGALTYKSVITEPIIVYNATPTVSYRKNKVGINYDFSENTNLTQPALVIKEHSTAKQIYLLGSNNLQATINLVNGEISGFTLEGGSW